MHLDPLCKSAYGDQQGLGLNEHPYRNLSYAPEKGDRKRSRKQATKKRSSTSKRAIESVANRRNMSDEQREKEQERVPKKPRGVAQGLSVSFHIGVHRRAYML